MTQRSPSDLLAEAMRLERHGAIRPLWPDLDDARKEFWRTRARFILEAWRRLLEAEGRDPAEAKP